MKERSYKRILYNQQNGNCYYCGVGFYGFSGMHSDGRTKANGYAKATIDHVKPRSKGGESRLDNYVLACVQCNSTKGDKEYPFQLTEEII